MKKLISCSIMVAVVLMVTSCSKKDRTTDLMDVPESIIVSMDTYSDMNGYWPEENCTLRIFDLIGGQTIHMGSVIVVIEGSIMYVKYLANADCKIHETHLFVGDIESDLFPTGKNGNPKIGHFPIKWEGAVPAGEVVHIIELNGTIDECTQIAAHAVVECDCGDDTCEETAWAKPAGSIFSLKSKMIDESDVVTFGITGAYGGGSWCTNFEFIDVNDALGKTISLVDWIDGLTKVGEVKVEKLGDVLRFTITSNFGTLDYSHLFLGSLELLNSIGICDHPSFPYLNPIIEGDSHIFEFPASILGTNSYELRGNSWGWYLDYCPEC